MHPLLANLRALLLYLGGWIFPALLLAYTLAAVGTVSFGEAAAVSAGACFLHASLCLSPWYLCRALPPRRTPLARLLAAHFAAATVAAGLFVLSANAAASLLPGFAPDLGMRVARGWPVLFGMGLFYYLLSSALHYVILAVELARDAETREMRARIEAREAELRALRAQLSPHFLFNSLNSISALAGADPPRARQMCVQLSDYLRGTLGLGASESVPLARELEMARNYLEIERVRFSGRLQFEQAIGPGCEACQVPALVLQPLLENAVKHGISNLLEGGTIRLAARRQDAALLIELENTFDPSVAPPTRGGMGLELVRRRLQARYGGAATLTTSVDDARFLVSLRLPCG
jgi:hypothetical protein